MAKFKTIRKDRLTNGKHFAFIEAFITAMTAAGFTAQRIVAALATLVAKFAVENEHYKKYRASEIVAQRTAADLERDSFYTRLHRLVQAWAGSGMELLDAAATALKRVFDLYKVKTTAQIDEETGQLDNLITDLETQEMQDYIAQINGTYLFQEMKTAHELVKSLRLEEGLEVSEKELGALATARKECDAAYDEVCTIIEGASAFADDPAQYDAFIKAWNGTIKIYQDTLDRKSGKDGGKDDGGKDDGGKDDGGKDDEGGDDQGGGDDPTPSPEPEPEPEPSTDKSKLLIGKQGTGGASVTDAQGQAIASGSMVAHGATINISVVPVAGKTPTATLNGSYISLTAATGGAFNGSVQMPARDSQLEIDTDPGNF